MTVLASFYSFLSIHLKCKATHRMYFTSWRYAFYVFRLEYMAYICLFQLKLQMKKVEEKELHRYSSDLHTKILRKNILLFFFSLPNSSCCYFFFLFFSLFHSCFSWKKITSKTIRTFPVWHQICKLKKFQDPFISKHEIAS